MNLKKTFGEYLVEKGAVSSEILLDAMMDQIQNMPSTCEVVFQHKLIDPAKMIKIFSLQSERQIDFISACKELGIWSEEIQRKIWDEMEKKQTPLIQIIVQKNDLSLEQINKLLDAYISESSTSDKTQPDNGIATAAQLNIQSDVIQVSSPAEITGGALEFISQFSEDVRQKLISYFDELKEKSALEQGIEMSHRLVGAARFAKLESLQRLFQILEAVLMTLKSAQTEIPSDELSMLCLNSKSTLEISKKLRAYVSKYSSESGYADSNPEDFHLLRQNLACLTEWLKAQSKMREK